MASSKLGISVTLTVPITVGQLEHLRKLAKKRGKSPTLLVRGMIKKYLVENPTPEPEKDRS